MSILSQEHQEPVVIGCHDHVMKSIPVSWKERLFVGIPVELFINRVIHGTSDLAGDS